MSSETTEESETTLFVFIRPVILRDDEFEGLKYLSERQLSLAGLPGDYPTSEPLTIEVDTLQRRVIGQGRVLPQPVDGDDLMIIGEKKFRRSLADTARGTGDENR